MQARIKVGAAHSPGALQAAHQRGVGLQADTQRRRGEQGVAGRGRGTSGAHLAASAPRISCPWPGPAGQGAQHPAQRTWGSRGCSGAAVAVAAEAVRGRNAKAVMGAIASVDSSSRGGWGVWGGVGRLGAGDCKCWKRALPRYLRPRPVTTGSAGGCWRPGSRIGPARPVAWAAWPAGVGPCARTRPMQARARTPPPSSRRPTGSAQIKAALA